MYSAEIQKYLQDRCFYVGINELTKIIKESPQITYWTFNFDYWTYLICANDGYSWNVRIFCDD